MPHKDPEARRAYQKARYEKLKAEDPDWVQKRKEISSRSFKKKYAQDEAFREKRKADHKRWYDEHGKENARQRKGYMSYEEWQAVCDEKRKSRREYMKQWLQTDAGRRRIVAQTIKKRCGMTIDEYDAAWDAQAGKCRICEVFKERYAKDRLAVDHCHKTGKFRALLCHNCNTAIGLLGESEEVMRNAIQYLREVSEGRGGL